MLVEHFGFRLVPKLAFVRSRESGLSRANITIIAHGRVWEHIRDDRHHHFSIKDRRLQMSVLKQVAGTMAIMSLLAAGLPVPTRAATTDTAGIDACSAGSTLPSCKPHSGWYCFHQGMIEPIFNFCDPNDTNC